MNEESGRGRHFYRVSKRRRRLFWIAFVVLLLAALLQATELPAAALAIDQLLKQNPDTNALVLASRYSERIGNGARALEYARIAVKRAPQDEIAQARLAEVLAASPKADERAEARE